MIDPTVTMVCLGAVLQAVVPARTVIASFRRRPNAREVQRALSFTPLPRRDRALEQLMAAADTAFVRRP